jgi:hypothetical protein
VLKTVLSVTDESYGIAADGLQRELFPLFRLSEGKGFWGPSLSTNILPLRGNWSCARHARLNRVVGTQPFGGCEDHL